MKSLEERHAEREKHRKQGPEGTVIEKDAETEKADDDFELNEKEPMRNKAPGSSREPAFFEAKVKGDDTIPHSLEVSRSADEAAAKASTQAAKTSGGAGTGNGGGKDWKPTK